MKEFRWVGGSEQSDRKNHCFFIKINTFNVVCINVQHFYIVMNVKGVFIYSNKSKPN